MIYIQDAQVVKSGQPLFQHFYWEIRAGENWMITGKNGSGKSTLLELVAGLVHPSQGKIAYDFIEGKTWEDRYADKRKKIKLIPTHASHSLFGNNSDMYYQQRYYASNDSARNVRDLFGQGIDAIHRLNIPASLSIDSLLDREVTRLSNGQLKKVLLLQSLLHDIPRMLLLDYPFEGLDSKSREELAYFIDFISIEYSIQIILVDHYHSPSVINRKLTLDNFAITSELPAALTELPSAGERMLRSEVTYLSQHPIVDIRNLSIRYGDTTILKNFSWTVYPGDRWALLGRNGSGKTTLFSLIFADHPMAYSQEIYLFGKRRGTGESIWDIKKRINYLGPELVSYMNPKAISLSGFDYVMSLHKKPDVTKLEELILFFEADFLLKPIKVLSSGQLQLMLIMNCFLEKKEILLLDEPFQFLDPIYKARVSEYLRSHLDKEITLILITHHDEDILNWTEKTMKI